MTPYRHLVTAGVALSIVGVLAGCGTGGGTSTGTVPKPNAVTNMTSNVTSVNNEVVSTPSNITPLSTNTSKHVLGNKNPSTHKTMPKYPYWTWLTSADSKPTVKTNYGTVSFSQLGITKNDISVFLAASGAYDTLYKFSQPGFKQVDGWQMEGSYLALNFGEPYSAHPTTGDYGYEDVVVDLQTKQVVLTTGSAIQSTDYLDTPYFVETAFNTASNGMPEFYIMITNLSAKRKITYQLPKNALGNAVESGGVIYYKVVNGKKQQIASKVLPKTGWQSIRDNKWKPILLPSKG